MCIKLWKEESSADHQHKVWVLDWIGTTYIHKSQTLSLPLLLVGEQPVPTAPNSALLLPLLCTKPLENVQT